MTMQPIGVVFPDVELWGTTYLRDALGQRTEPWAAVDLVSNRVPTTRKNRMVIVRRDGGTSDGLRDVARVSVQVWAKTEQDATDLARLVAALLWAAPNGDPVLKVVQQSGPTPIADTSGQPLRYLVFEIHTRGEAL
jgi:hypothetical protein